jgi:hypothetical protein
MKKRMSVENNFWAEAKRRERLKLMKEREKSMEWTLILRACWNSLSRVGAAQHQSEKSN